MKKGFTLIELIITIGLLAVIGTVISTNILGTLDKQQENTYNNFKETLENAACTYVESNEYIKNNGRCSKSNGCTITISKLLEKGLIEDNDLINPKTQKKLVAASSTIEVSYHENQKKCTLKTIVEE